MDTDLSHEALERFDELDKRISALEQAGPGGRPHEETTESQADQEQETGEEVAEVEVEEEPSSTSSRRRR